MKKSVSIKSVLLFLLPILFILQIVVQTSCANIVPPAGGPRDSLPPVLLKATPPDKTRNFSDNKIVLTFDEFVDLDNPSQNIIVSPLPKTPVPASRKLNTVTVKLKDTLEPNTTYTIDFGPSIKDVNESNVLKNFSYTFTTGKYFDSLQFSGKVVLAQTGEADSTLTVMLHRDKEDSSVFYKRPRYVTKVDNKGAFHFKNLSPGTYYVYALKDEGGSYQYRGAQQIFAFSDSVVKVGPATNPVTLYAYTAEKPSATSGSSSTTPAATHGNNRPSAADKRLRLATNLKSGRQDLLEKFIFTFETKIKSFDSTKIHLSTDTTFTPVTSGYKWTLDSTKKNLVLTYTWKENTPYNLIIEKDFATDTLGQQLLKKDTLKFTTKSVSDYGKLSIRFRNIDLAKNPVLQFVQSNQVVASYPLNSDTFNSDMFIPGEYDLRVLNDTNKNGVWDPGDFFGKHKQPELVKPIPRKVSIKANWENAFEIML